MSSFRRAAGAASDFRLYADISRLIKLEMISRIIFTCILKTLSAISAPAMPQGRGRRNFLLPHSRRYLFNLIADLFCGVHSFFAKNASFLILRRRNGMDGVANLNRLLKATGLLALIYRADKSVFA